MVKLAAKSLPDARNKLLPKNSWQKTTKKPFKNSKKKRVKISLGSSQDDELRKLCQKQLPYQTANVLAPNWQKTSYESVPNSQDKYLSLCNQLYITFGYNFATVWACRSLMSPACLPLRTHRPQWVTFKHLSQQAWGARVFCANSTPRTWMATPTWYDGWPAPWVSRL